MRLRNAITSPNLGCIRATRSCKRQRRCTACPMKVFESLTGTGRPPTIPILGSLKGAHRFSIAKASGMTSAPISTTTGLVAFLRNRLIAEALPSRFFCTHRRIRGSFSAISDTIGTVRSVHPLATTITSSIQTVGPVCSRTD